MICLSFKVEKKIDESMRIVSGVFLKENRIFRQSSIRSKNHQQFQVFSSMKSRLLILVFIYMLFVFNKCEKIKNYQVSDNQSGQFLQCSYGYEYDEQKKECQVKKWIQIIGISLTIKYLEPIFNIRNIFIDFIHQFWFFPVNYSHSIKSNKLTSLINLFNHQRLWPFEIKTLTQQIIGKDNFNQIFLFFNQDKQNSITQDYSNKKDLIFLDQKNFNFTYSCLIRIILSWLISIIIYSLLQFLQRISSYLLNSKVQSKIQFKGALLYMMMNQLYHFTGFYGFYELRKMNGFVRMGPKVNIILTVLIVFIFLFLSVCELPILYHLNQSRESKDKTNTQTTILKSISKRKQVHRVLMFSNSFFGFCYHLIHRHFKYFITGALIGYFTNHYFLLTLIYSAELATHQRLIEGSSQKSYFIFRKVFVVLTTIYLLFLEEEMVHMFSDKNQSFQVIRQILLCAIFILSLLDSLLSLLQFIVRNYHKFTIWRQKNKRGSQLVQKSQNIIKIRRSNRQPSIALKVLKKLKEQKNSQIISGLSRKKIIYLRSSS